MAPDLGNAKTGAPPQACAAGLRSRPGAQEECGHVSRYSAIVKLGDGAGQRNCS